MSITVYGASDDLIEVEGDIEEEFAASDGSGYLGFSDGTLLSIDYSRDGVWRIAPLSRGAGPLNIEQAPAGDEDNYSDRATIDSEVRWVIYGDMYVTR